jgi:hypothetical protein
MLFTTLFLFLSLVLWVIKIYYHLKALQISKGKEKILFNEGLTMDISEIIRCSLLPFWGGNNKKVKEYNFKGNIFLLLFFLLLIVCTTVIAFMIIE